MAKKRYRPVRVEERVWERLVRYREELETGRDLGRRAPDRSPAPGEPPPSLSDVVAWLLDRVDAHRARARKARVAARIRRTGEMRDDEAPLFDGRHPDEVTS